MKSALSLLFILFSAWQGLAQDELLIQNKSIAGLPGLQSFAHGHYQGKYFLIGGRLDGLHQRQPFASFDAAGHSTQIWVLEADSNRAYPLYINTLADSIYDQLKSTNIEYYQVDSLLYLVGGYGLSQLANDHRTHPYLTVLNLKTLAQLNPNTAVPSSALQSHYDTGFAVTGGQLKYLNNQFYLVGGNRFDGRYNPHNGPSFTQRYTDAVRIFNYDLSQGQYSWDTAWVDPQLLHRRDYNVTPEIRLDGSYGVVAYSGVFQTQVDLPFLNAVQISPQGYSEIPNFSQYYNHYHCAYLPLYDAQNNEMHTLFFGGIAQYFDQNGVLTSDNSVPFVKTIARVTRNNQGQYQEYKLQSEMPALLGAGSEFLINPNLPIYAEDIIDFNALSGDTIFLGYILGGIESSAPNVFFTNTGNESWAHDELLEVYLIKARLGLGSAVNLASTQKISWQMGRGADQQGFNIWYHQGSIGGDYRLDAHSLDGRLLKTYHWQAPNQSGSYQKNFQLDPGISEASLILSLYHNNTLVSSQQLIYQAGGRH